MNKLFSFLFSSRLMGALLLIFGFSIGIATFIENDFGSSTARALVYHSRWFEAMLFLGMINLTGTIIIHKLYRKEKLSIFIFHFAFLIILIGSAITHFFGYEGVMHIREGNTSQELITERTYFSAIAIVNNHTAEASKPANFSALSDNNFKLSLNTAGKSVSVECVEYIPNAVQALIEDADGKPTLELVIAGAGSRQSVYLTEKQSGKIGGLVFSLNDSTNHDGVSIFFDKEGLRFSSAVETFTVSMSDQSVDTLKKNQPYPFQLLNLYNFAGLQVVAKSFLMKGKIDAVASKEANPEQNSDALRVKITSGDESKTILYMAARTGQNESASVQLNDMLVKVYYGARVIPLPFSVHLKKFILEHYPGSESPAWFESLVNVQEGDKLLQDQRIYMNHILSYGGYRFYQSSYDTDGKGTILSVNHDFWGSFITYLGYLFLTIGMIWSLVNPNSYFRKLSIELARLREIRKSTIAVLLFVILPIAGLQSQTVPDSFKIDKTHAAKFGQLLIQDPGGRIKPVNSLSSEFLRKICRSDKLLDQNSDQVLLGMLVYPGFWQEVPIIRVSHPDILNILQIKGKLASFNNIFNIQSKEHQYKLARYVQQAYLKKPGERNKFDNEIIKFDERVNLCYMVYTGEFLRLFPKEGDPSRTWVSPGHTTGVFKGPDSLFVEKFFPWYAQSVIESSHNGNWQKANEVVGYLHKFQQKFGGDIIPSDFKVKLETWYANLNIFDRISSVYGIIGFLLLVLQLWSVFRPRLNLKPYMRIAIGIIVVCFVFHLAGLVARWYIAGHAPWSNAYESLIYIAFATVLAGILFSRTSAITLSATSLLAWLILFVAHLSWMDPEITNLVPVLNSYWLVVHVAIITASYGFMALGALLAFLNLILMALQSPQYIKTSKDIIHELTLVIEMTLIIGLYMLTIGTFLGGVWANESWGRYWGWDSKETWALVSILIYAFVSHVRMIPGLKGTYTFNLLALVAFSSIIMTYFGVNFYLSGLHSYAKGDPIPVPLFIYYSIVTVALVAVLAWWKQKKVSAVN